MPFQSKSCLHCNKELVLKCTRDITRKKFCSHSCRQLYRWKTGSITWLAKAQRLASTPEANLKKSHKGSLHPFYKVDRTTIKSPRPRYELDQWRKSIFLRDNFTCIKCGTHGGKLQADHILPYCAFPESRFDLNNGRTLCVSCHKETDTYAGRARVFLSHSNQKHK